MSWTPGQPLPPERRRRVPEHGSARRASAAAEELTDGEWHRLHPATPVLRGGFFLVVVLGYVINSFREQLVNAFIPQSGGGRRDGGGNQGDPVAYVIANRLEWIAALGILGVLVILVGIFYVSWRMNTFRVTDETVEVRRGVIFRTSRRARLDRIQGINVQRPLFARIFGAARLEIDQAGHDANVPLAYLRSAAADDVRREILRRAGGVREAEREQGDTGRRPGGGLIEQRLHEFMASPLGEDTEREVAAAGDHTAARGTAVDYGPMGEVESPSVVRMHLGRLIGSAILTRFTVFLVVIIAVVVVSIVTTGQYFLLVIFFPTILGSFSYYSRRVVKSLRYSIASTRDGIRIGWGLLSTSNETLPPGRIHSIKLNQPLAWRPFGWWEVKINRASHASGKGADNQANTTILPVGSAGDVAKVLGLILPELVGLTVADLEAQAALDRGEATPRDIVAAQPRRAVEEGARTLSLIEAGMTSTGAEGGFTTSPRRGQWLRWFSWRRNGFRTAPGAILLRKGAIWRELVVVPLPRVQSVGLRQGPLLRRLRLASVELHTVQGPIAADIGALDEHDAMAFFESASADAVVAARADRTHRWLEAGGETGAPRASGAGAPAPGAHGAEAATGMPATGRPATGRPPTGTRATTTDATGAEAWAIPAADSRLEP